MSGKEYLDFDGEVSTAAPAGAAGSLLLDPTDILIADGSGDGASDGPTTFAGSPSGTPGVVDGGDSGPTIIYENELRALTATTDISLAATNDIIVADLSDNRLLLRTRGRSLTLTADSDGSGDGGFIMTIPREFTAEAVAAAAAAADSPSALSRFCRVR